jgi:hypothetical protein
MPKLSHSKSKIRHKKMQRLQQRAAAQSGGDMLTPVQVDIVTDDADAEFILSPDELAAIVIALDPPEPPAVQADSDTDDDIAEFGSVAHSFFA